MCLFMQHISTFSSLTSDSAVCFYSRLSGFVTYRFFLVRCSCWCFYFLAYQSCQDQSCALLSQSENSLSHTFLPTQCRVTGRLATPSGTRQLLARSSDSTDRSGRLTAALVCSPSACFVELLPGQQVHCSEPPFWTILEEVENISWRAPIFQSAPDICTLGLLDAFLLARHPVIYDDVTDEDISCH